MKTNYFVMSVLLMALLVIMNCQEKSETGDQKTESTPVELVQAMDEYHRVLRPLMHQALPDKNTAAFKNNSQELLDCAVRISKAGIPEKLDTQKNEIENLINAILDKTRALHQATQTGSDNDIFNTFMAAHDDYEALADVVYKL